jgi:hypothetical protein
MGFYARVHVGAPVSGSTGSRFPGIRAAQRGSASTSQAFRGASTRILSGAGPCVSVKHGARLNSAIRLWAISTRPKMVRWAQVCLPLRRRNKLVRRTSTWTRKGLTPPSPLGSFSHVPFSSASPLLRVTSRASTPSPNPGRGATQLVDPERPKFDNPSTPALTNSDSARHRNNQSEPHSTDRVWCSGNIVDSHCSAVTALSTAPGSTPGIRVASF